MSIWVDVGEKRLKLFKAKKYVFQKKFFGLKTSLASGTTLKMTLTDLRAFGGNISIRRK